MEEITGWLTGLRLGQHSELLENWTKEELKGCTDGEGRAIVNKFPAECQEKVHDGLERLRGALFKRAPPGLNVALADKVGRMADITITAPVLISGDLYDSADDSSDVEEIDYDDFEERESKVGPVEAEERRLVGEKLQKTATAINDAYLFPEDDPEAPRLPGTSAKRQPDLMSYMEKKRPGMLSIWQRRYFILMGETLFWFKNHTARLALGFLKITDADVKSVTMGANSVLLIETVKKTYRIRAARSSKDPAHAAPAWHQALAALREQHQERTAIMGCRRDRLACATPQAHQDVPMMMIETGANLRLIPTPRAHQAPASSTPQQSSSGSGSGSPQPSIHSQMLTRELSPEALLALKGSLRGTEEFHTVEQQAQQYLRRQPTRTREATLALKKELGPYLSGEVMGKYKYKKRHTRLVWVADLLDYVVWSPVEQKNKPKGFMQISSIQSIKKGCSGCKGPFGFTIIAASKFLALEARDQEQMDRWISTIQRLIDLAKTTTKPGLVPH